MDLQKDAKDMSANLLRSASKFAIFSAQVAGYLPLSLKIISKNSKNLLSFKLISFPVFWTLLTALIVGGWTTIYYTSFKKRIRFVRIFGPTEAFAYTILVVLGASTGVYLRIRSIRNAHIYQEFFHKNLQLLIKFRNFGFELKEISKIEKYLRKSFFAYFVPLIVHVILVHGVRPAKAYYDAKRRWLPDNVYTIGSGAWVLFSYLLISNLYIILFPRIYSACYQELSKDIRLTYSLQNYYSKEICGPAFKKSDMKTDYDFVYESKVHEYVELIVELEKMIDNYNKVFGERLICEMVICITYIILYSFFGFFWAVRGEVRIIGEVLTPLYLHTKKLVELGYTCGNISKEAQVTMKTLVENVPLDRINLHLRRKIQLMQIKVGANPPVVSAKQFFTISRGSVTTVLSGMAGFLIALVQFRQGDSN